MASRAARKGPVNSTGRTRLPWWILLTVCALTLGTLIILAIGTSAPLVLIAEAISVVLLAVTTLVKALRD